MIDHVALSPENLSRLCPDCKALLSNALGLTYVQTQSAAPAVREDDAWEYAELGLQAARAFLLGCNAKTRRTLRMIVDSGDSFSIRQLETRMDVERGSLRAFWGGLTKRTRTITGDPDASLIEWGEQTDTGDYVGRLTPTTREAFKRALAE